MLIYNESFLFQIFDGNTDKYAVVNHTLAMPITARYVQIIPVDWHDWISMRAEFYGCVLSGICFE